MNMHIMMIGIDTLLIMFGPAALCAEQNWKMDLCLRRGFKAAVILGALCQWMQEDLSSIAGPSVKQQVDAL
jgi:hypothetical protein